MNPGRKKIEEREAQFVAVGCLVLDPHGVEWEVTDLKLLRLILKRTSDGEMGVWWVRPTEPIRVRVPKEDR